ncbi:hypothetical protein F5B22DRAFT_632327 [Xylaria bambusicola]|uniref:uncharacterized protein n=1 Tax=Xylaria bambusicola TaxID=326684 RepID=UPI002008BD97|nr:uncharacterized protein F5B22DRAFT_632327 [Xylaria bambusicola]KAI0502712.1 hypothetical protein F5B22DRAFT_632327 [Xylaria bambusicola]
MDSLFYESDISTNAFSNNEINSNNELPNSNNELITLSENDVESTAKSSINSKDYNNKSFQLNDENSSIYILKEGLFIRTLLPINPNKERKMIVKCISYQYSKTVKVKRFQSFNFVKHY